MKVITFYDTETTGLPDWNQPSEIEQQPHIVSLAAIQCNAETREIIQMVDLIVFQNDDWEMKPDALEKHKITPEYARKVGINELGAITILTDLCSQGERVSHNRTFDQRMVRIGLKRYNCPEPIIDLWANKDDHHCTMLKAKPIMKLLPKNKWGFKSPKLEEAYKFFCGKELGDKAHSAMPDAKACMEIFWAIEDWEKQNGPGETYADVKEKISKSWDEQKTDPELLDQLDKEEPFVDAELHAKEDDSEPVKGDPFLHGIMNRD